MLKINGVELADIKVNAINIETAKKNNYFDPKTGKSNSILINGSISIKGSLEYQNDDELVNKLNNLEDSLKSGILSIDDTNYEVELKQGLYQGMDFGNFELIFSWNGFVIINGEKRDLSE